MSTHLWNICTDNFFPRRHKIRSKQTRNQYRYALNDFEKFLGRPATDDDLTDDTVTLWLGDMLLRGEAADDPRSIETAVSKVKRVLSLWRFLACRREVERFPTVELPDIPDPEPIALDEDELRRLFESAHCRPGFICGVPARYYWPACIGFVLSTSERRGATLATRWAWIDFKHRAVSIPAAVRKGRKKQGAYPLWDEVAWLLRRIIEPARELVFPFDRSDATWYKEYGRILIDAGLPNDRKHKLQCLRVTHNTWVKVMTGHHSPLLMHSSSATSERHYEDRRFTITAPPKPFTIPVSWQS